MPRRRPFLVEQFEHLLDRLDTGNRFGGVGKGKRDSAYQLAVDINGASAHSSDDPRARKRTAGKPGQNHVLLGREVLEHTENFDIELLDLRSLKDRLPEAFHARTQFVHRHKLGGLRRNCEGKCSNQKHG